MKLVMEQWRRYLASQGSLTEQEQSVQPPPEPAEDDPSKWMNLDKWLRQFKAEMEASKESNFFKALKLAWTITFRYSNNKIIDVARDLIRQKRLNYKGITLPGESDTQGSHYVEFSDRKKTKSIYRSVIELNTTYWYPKIEEYVNLIKFNVDNYAQQKAPTMSAPKTTEIQPGEEESASPIVKVETIRLAKESLINLVAMLMSMTIIHELQHAVDWQRHTHQAALAEKGHTDKTTRRYNILAAKSEIAATKASLKHEGDLQDFRLKTINDIKAWMSPWDMTVNNSLEEIAEKIDEFLINDMEEETKYQNHHKDKLAKMLAQQDQVLAKK